MTRIFILLLCFASVLLCVMSAAVAQERIVPPLHTSGYQILDAGGHPVRLTSVNWYGFDQKEFVAGGLDHAPLQVIIDADQSYRSQFGAVAVGERDG